MDKPFFSIIIPALNEEKCLPKLLSCLEKQKYKNFEVLVVDAESSDNTVLEVKKFTQKLPFLIILQSGKKNLAYQRNLGGNKARGEYLCFFDADVLIPNDFFSKIEKYIQKTKSKLLTTWMKGDINSFPYPQAMIVPNLVTESLKIIGKPFTCGSNIIVAKTAFLKVGGFREDMAMSEDHDFSIRVVKTGFPLHILKDPKHTYSLRRIRSEGVFSVLKKYIIALSYFLLKGDFKKKFFEYKMGGQAHEKAENRE